MTTFKYSINLMWSDEDESYVATIPEFPGLSVFGDTPEEAVEEAKIAAEGFMEVFKEDGRLLPDPVLLTPLSGQFRIRIPKSLHGSLTAEAAKEGVSLNTHVVTLLSERNAYHKVQRAIEAAKPNLIMIKENTTETDPLDKWFVTAQYKNWSGITPSLMRQRG
jgi:antitoxin HicB